MHLPDPAQVIDRDLLTVSPDTPLLKVLAKMNQVWGSQCNLLSQAGANNQEGENATFFLTPDFTNYQVTSYVLIVEEGWVRGIVTERDVVKFVVTKQNLAVSVGEVMTKPVITLAESEFRDVFVVLSLLRQHHIRHLPIVDDRGKLVGIVTAETIRRVLQPVNLLTIRRVAEVMSTQIIHASASTSVLSLARLMTEYRVSCVVITRLLHLNSNSPILRPIGIVTERDIVQLQILGLDMEHIQAETVMSQPLFCLHSEDSLWVAHQEMQRRFVRRLVVIGNQGELLGLITQTNIMRSLDPLELYSVVKTLQQAVEERTTQLSQANEQLQIQAQEVRQALEKEQEVNALKTQFISMVSHEFRNPLTSIIGLADLLETCEGKLCEQKKHYYLNCIVDSANRMLNLVENILVIGKAELAELEPHPVPINLSAFCEELLSQIQFYDVGQHHLNFSYQGEEDSLVYFDENVLRHILTNLLSNAIKYSPRGTKVSLELFVEGNRVVFQVRDAGIGIPPEAQQRLFESFHRAENVGNIPGTGLGLAIVKRYVDLVNGQISVKSDLGIGTTFTVTLPLNQQA